MKPKRVLSILLALALSLGLLALTPITASAWGEIGIQAGLPTFEVNTATPTIVGFGGKQWAVIGYNGNGVVSSSGKLTLLLANGQSYGMSAFDSSPRNSNEYADSTLRTAVDSAYNALPAKEKALVVFRQIDGGSGLAGLSTYHGNNVAGLGCGVYFWPLGSDEAEQVNMDVRKFNHFWWLRTPGDAANTAGNVSANGSYIYGRGGATGLVSGENALRPAFVLDTSKVIFVSDASGASKKSDAAMALFGMHPTQAVSRVVKFTMRDSALTLGNVTVTRIRLNSVEFTYTGATPGKTLSAVVLSSGGEVKRYVKLQTIDTSGSGSTVVGVSEFSPTDTVQIFVEECNGDNETDFASAFKQLDFSQALSGGSANRTSDTAATINFTTNMDGTAYYLVRNTGAAAPSKNTVKAQGTSLGDITPGNVTDKPVTLTAGAKDIYVVIEKPYFGTISEPLKIPVAAYVPPYTVTYNGGGGMVRNGGSWYSTVNVPVPAGTSTTTPACYKGGAVVPTLACYKGYEIECDLNGGTYLDNVEWYYIDGNFTCNGWFTAASGGTKRADAGAAYTPTQTETLYAQWTNTTMGTLPTPTRSGYRFDGWFTAASGGTQVSSSTVISGNTTIYAHWTQTYTVTYNLNGGGGTAPTESAKAAGATFTAASAAGMTAPSGKQFKQWNTASNGSGTGYAPGATVTMPTGNLTLYAIWENIPTANYTLTLNANGGSVTPTSVTQTQGTNYTLPTPTRSGFNFTGWTVTSGGGSVSGNTYTFGTSNGTVTAGWTAISTPADKAALNGKLADARAIARGNYTEASWNALQNAINTAQAVANNGSATQAEVDAQVTALNNAIAGLANNPVTPPAKYIKLWGKVTKYLDNFGNWMLVIFCFGWIWMAF